MSQTATSKIKGLHKHHNRRCTNRHGKPTNCDCPWYGFYKRIQKGLAEWSGQQGYDDVSRGVERHREYSQ